MQAERTGGDSRYSSAVSVRTVVNAAKRPVRLTKFPLRLIGPVSSEDLYLLPAPINHNASFHISSLLLAWHEMRDDDVLKAIEK